MSSPSLNALAMLKGDMVDILTRLNDIEERLDELSLERQYSTNEYRLKVIGQTTTILKRLIILPY